MSIDRCTVRKRVLLRERERVCVCVHCQPHIWARVAARQKTDSTYRIIFLVEGRFRHHAVLELKLEERDKSVLQQLHLMW